MADRSTAFFVSDVQSTVDNVLSDASEYASSEHYIKAVIESLEKEVE